MHKLKSIFSFPLGVTSGMLPIAKTIKENYFLKKNLHCLEKFLPKREQKSTTVALLLHFLFLLKIADMEHSL